MVKAEPDAQVLRWFQARKAYELWVSAMTLAELRRGVNRMPPSKRQSELAALLINLEIGFKERRLDFDRKAAKVWAVMTSEAEAQGESMSAFDSIIAATARANGCKLVTRNVKDFHHAGIEVLDPWLKK